MMTKIQHTNCPHIFFTHCMWCELGSDDFTLDFGECVLGQYYPDFELDDVGDLIGDAFKQWVDQQFNTPPVNGEPVVDEPVVDEQAEKTKAYERAMKGII